MEPRTDSEGLEFVRGITGAEEYSTKRAIALAAIAEGGTIFGGYVRDSLIHSHYENLFYGNKASFGDASVSPETRDRLLIPKDIDVIFKDEASLKMFKANLKANKFEVHTMGIVKVYGKNGMKHVKLCIAVPDVTPEYVKKLIRLSLPPSYVGLVDTIDIPDFRVSANPIYVDAIIGDGVEYPLDFECNGLIMDSTGIHLGRDLAATCDDPMKMFTRFNHIVSDIVNKVAKAFVTPSPTRITKMAEKGWNVLLHTIQISHNAKDEICLVCHEELSTNVTNLTCCNAMYHASCFKRAYEFPNSGIRYSNKCFHCRQELFMLPYEEDFIKGYTTKTRARVVCDTF